MKLRDPILEGRNDPPRRAIVSRLGIGDVEMVGHVELRERLRDVIERIHRDRHLIALTNHNRVEAYLVAADELGRLAEAEEQLDRLRSSLPVLVAALRTGVAYPAETLQSFIGSDLAIDWRRMNAFQAAFPIESTVDEDGAPLAKLNGELRHEPIAELDDELRYG
jgi:PHD/YefM family antitoxin component YafN of YafNO toxin-antitoxin module